MLFELLSSNYFWIFVVAFLISYIMKQIIDVKTGRIFPGPWGLPYVGYLFFLSEYHHKDFMKLSKRDCLKLPQTGGRPETSGLVVASREAGESSLIFRNGDAAWKQIRKTSVKALALFSTSRNSRLEQIIHEAVENLRQKLEACEGQPLDTTEGIMICTATITSSLAFGRDPDPEDPLLQRIFQFFQVVGEQFGKLGPADYLPILEIFHKKTKRAIDTGMKDFVEYVTEKIHEHHFDGTVGTIADGLRRAIEEAEDEDLKAVGLTKEDILMAAIDIFDGSFFTTSENTAWFQLLMASHQDIQKRIQEEINTVVGRDRLPSILDQANMPYTSACILEELRFVSNLPLSLQHCAMEDFAYQGRLIEKGTIIIPNTYAVHHDPRVFPDPETFKPSRFLSKGKVSMEESSKILIFSSGTRRCPGENVAKQELFLMNAAILQEFHVSLDPETKGNPLDPRPGLSLAPGFHKLIYRKRT